MSSRLSAEKVAVKDKFFDLLRSASLEDGFERYHIHLGQSYGANTLILGWNYEPYREAIETVHEIYPQVSQKTIAGVLSRSVVKLFNEHNVSDEADPEANAPIIESILDTIEPSAVEEEITHFLGLLESEIKRWTAFVMLEGIKLKDMNELPLGDAILYRRDKGPLREAIKEAHNEVNHIQDLFEFAAEHCQSYLIVDVEGEDRFANQQAHRKVSNLVSVLHLYAVSYEHRVGSYKRVGILGQPSVTHVELHFKQTPPIGIDSPNPTYHMSSHRSEVLSHEIDRTSVQRWKENGLDKVLEYVARPDAESGSAEMRVQNAITWYNRALNAYTSDEQFIGLIIALESLLVADEKLRITQRLADGVSALIGTDFQHRKDIARRVRNLYKLRCNLVHGGIPVSKEKLFDLDRIVSSTIRTFILREMS